MSLILSVDHQLGAPFHTAHTVADAEVVSAGMLQLYRHNHNWPIFPNFNGVVILPILPLTPIEELSDSWGRDASHLHHHITCSPSKHALPTGSQYCPYPPCQPTLLQYSFHFLAINAKLTQRWYVTVDLVPSVCGACFCSVAQDNLIHCTLWLYPCQIAKQF